MSLLNKVFNRVTAVQQRFNTTEVAGNYTTSGESVIYADPSGTGGITITLASADAVDGTVIELYDVGEAAGSNPITVATEGTEVINPGGKSSITLDVSGGYVKLRNRAGDWFVDRTRQVDLLDTDNLSLAGRTIDNILESEATGQRVEHGSQSFGSLGTSSTDDFSDWSTQSISLSFATAFSSAPEVVVGGGANSFYTYGQGNISTTGFDIKARNFSTTSISNGTSWLAVGPE